MEKTCRDCGESKPMDAFYRHRAMTDGRLNSCKACRKAYAIKWRLDNLDVARERSRQQGRTEKHRERVRKAAHKYKRTHQEVRKYIEQNQDKRRAHNAVNNAIRVEKLKVKPCERCGYAIGVQAHHEDYSKPLEVTWLCRPCHGVRHQEINDERRRSA